MKASKLIAIFLILAFIFGLYYVFTTYREGDQITLESLGKKDDSGALGVQDIKNEEELKVNEPVRTEDPEDLKVMLQQNQQTQPAQPTKPAQAKIYSSAPAMQLEEGADYKAVIKTNKGDIAVDLFEDKVPVTVNNFVFLAKEGFYTNTKSHRIIRNFMIQFGDPFTADDSLKAYWGTGDPGYKFADEPFDDEYLRGTLAMANSGPNTNGCQFFIVHKDKIRGELSKNYVIFGRVTDVASLAVVDLIAETPVVFNSRGENSSPSEPIIVSEIAISAEQKI